MAHLAPQRSLAALGLIGCTQLTSATLAHVAALAGLRDVFVSGCRFTADELAQWVPHVRHARTVQQRRRSPENNPFADFADL